MSDMIKWAILSIIYWVIAIIIEDISMYISALIYVVFMFFALIIEYRKEDDDD